MSQLDTMTRMARARFLKFSEIAIRKSYKAKRIQFFDGKVQYIDKQGNIKEWTAEGLDEPIDRFAAFMWDRLNDELMSHAMLGATANMTVMGVTVSDIRDVILKIKDGG